MNARVAIVLAAAWVESLSLAETVGEIEQSLDLPQTVWEA